jgi:hypothetical protein
LDIPISIKLLGDFSKNKFLVGNPENKGQENGRKQVNNSSRNRIDCIKVGFQEHFQEIQKILKVRSQGWLKP